MAASHHCHALTPGMRVPRGFQRNALSLWKDTRNLRLFAVTRQQVFLHVCTVWMTCCHLFRHARQTHKTLLISNTDLL